MVRIKIESSNLSEIEYSDETQELKVWFKNRKDDDHYVYFDVSPSVFGELMLASSHGKYFSEFIRDVFKAKKVESK